MSMERSQYLDPTHTFKRARARVWPCMDNRARGALLSIGRGILFFVESDIQYKKKYFLGVCPPPF